MYFESYQSRESQNELNKLKEMNYKRKNDFVKDYIVIDFETTGFNCYNDEIIEIGAIKYRNFVEVDRFEQIIKPKTIVSPYILELTGITQLEINESPDIESVIHNFLVFIGDLPLVAHNSSFDMRFLMYSLIKTKTDFTEFTSIDTLTLSRRYIDETKNHKLKTLKNFIGMNKNQSHRAIDDCLVTNEIYKLCYSRKDEPKYISKLTSRGKLNLNELIAESVVNIDKDHPLHEVKICFTGTLNNLTRKEVGQILVNLGAIPQNNVTTKTEYLVLGEKSYVNYIESDKKTGKLLKAIEYQKTGQNIKVISESDFIDILETQSR